MNSEKVPVFKISAPGTSSQSERPSTAFSHHSVASEHGPRSSWSESAIRRSASQDTVATYLGTRPVRLFKHQRPSHHGDAALSSIARVPDTEVTYPKTLHEVEHWLSDVVATA